jgi:2-iminobutanoate/2-iminopropanoate deaminase
MVEGTKVVKTRKAPQAIGPYSQGVIAQGEFLFVSGQIPLDPESGNLVEGGIVEQTQRVLKNVKAILQAHALTLEHVVKTTVFMTDLGEFTDMNKVYGEFFKEGYPARSTIQVAALPKGARVEIEAICVVQHD